MITADGVPSFLRAQPWRVEDGLASNGPHVRLLKELDMSFVLGGDHKALFAWVDELESAPQASASKPGVKRWETKDADGTEYCFRWSNGAPPGRARLSACPAGRIENETFNM